MGSLHIDFRTNLFVHSLSNVSQFIGYYPFLIYDGFNIVNLRRKAQGLQTVSPKTYIAALVQTFFRRFPFQFGRGDIKGILEFVRVLKHFGETNDLSSITHTSIKYFLDKLGLSYGQI